LRAIAASLDRRAKSEFGIATIQMAMASPASHDPVDAGSLERFGLQANACLYGLN
jgi:hypothetical protein